MRRAAIGLVLLLVLPAQAGLIMRRAAACAAEWTEAWASNILSECETHDGAGALAYSAGNASVYGQGYTWDYRYASGAAQLTSVNHWFCARLRSAWGAYAGFMLRNPGTDDGQAYTIYYDEADFNWFSTFPRKDQLPVGYIGAEIFHASASRGKLHSVFEVINHPGVKHVCPACGGDHADRQGRHSVSGTMPAPPTPSRSS